MPNDISSAHAAGTSGDDISSIVTQLNVDNPRAIVFFTSDALTGVAIGKAIRQRFPETEVIGASSFGEFSDQGNGTGGISAIALGPSKVRRCVAQIIRHEKGIPQEVKAMARAFSQKLGQDLRELDGRRHVGLVLLDWMSQQEELVNQELGNVAPQLSFVGGSAADHLQFKDTRVLHNGEESKAGTVVMVLELNVPFKILKTCSVETTTRNIVITKAIGRKVYEIDGQPAAKRYAELIGTTPDKLAFDSYVANPLGMLIEGEWWLRVPASVDGDILTLACAAPEGAQMQIMKSANIVTETRQALERAKSDLGVPVSGGLMFNCVYRRIQVDAAKQTSEYHRVLSGFPLAGFHTFGESWLGHLNQTLTGILLG